MKLLDQLRLSLLASRLEPCRGRKIPVGSEAVRLCWADSDQGLRSQLQATASD